MMPFSHLMHYFHYFLIIQENSTTIQLTIIFNGEELYVYPALACLHRAQFSLSDLSLLLSWTLSVLWARVKSVSKTTSLSQNNESFKNWKPAFQKIKITWWLIWKREQLSLQGCRAPWVSFCIPSSLRPVEGLVSTRKRKTKQRKRTEGGRGREGGREGEEKEREKA